LSSNVQDEEYFEIGKKAMSAVVKTGQYEKAKLLETIFCIPPITKKLCKNKEELLQCFKQGIPINISFESLELQGNEIGDEGAKFIGESLSLNSTLTQLNLKCIFPFYNQTQIVILSFR
jgi:hypothetical protein